MNLEERYMIYSTLIACTNPPKYDGLIFGSVKKKRINKSNKKNNKSSIKLKAGAMGGRILAVYFFIIPRPPSNLWMAKRVVNMLLEKGLLVLNNSGKMRCGLGEGNIFSMARQLDNFEIEKYLFK